MALDQAAHHVGLARGPERGADLLGLLDLDQAVDDVATLQQQAMHAFIDRVDLLAQLGKRRRGGRRLRHLMKPGEFSILILRSAKRRLEGCRPVLPHGARRRKSASSP